MVEMVWCNLGRKSTVVEMVWCTSGGEHCCSVDGEVITLEWAILGEGALYWRRHCAIRSERARWWTGQCGASQAIV